MSLAAIIKATRASASALAAQQRQGRKLDDLHRQLAEARRQADAAQGAAAIHAAELRVFGIEVAVETVERARRAAHRRWCNAQAVLAAHRLPGDR